MIKNRAEIRNFIEVIKDGVKEMSEQKENIYIIYNIFISNITYIFYKHIKYINIYFLENQSRRCNVYIMGVLKRENGEN